MSTAVSISRRSAPSAPTAVLKSDSLTQCQYLQARSVIKYPQPSLLVLAGPSGVGKSSFAERLLPTADVLSSDRMRGLISGDESSMEVSGQAFALLHEVAARRLRAGRSVIIDSTALEVSARAQLIEVARTAGVSAHLLLLEGSRALCLEGQKWRDRTVPVEAVERHLALQQELVARIQSKRMAAEGFSTVLRVSRRESFEIEKISFG
jgi:predicted kinase